VVVIGVHDVNGAIPAKRGEPADESWAAPPILPFPKLRERENGCPNPETRHFGGEETVITDGEGGLDLGHMLAQGGEKVAQA
jgi:hypothetical protein